MPREVRDGGDGRLHVRFPFDRRLVDRIRSLPSRRWDATRRVWVVPATDVVALVECLAGEDFAYDEPTRALYAARGGSEALEPARGARLPGLFDEPERASPGVETSDDDGWTVAGLNEAVRDTLRRQFPEPVWVVGEVSGFNKNRHRRHVSFELVEREASGEVRSKLAATLFESTRAEVERALAAEGDPFALQDEIAVRLLVRVELYVPWGSYRVIVEALDVRYTLGEAARRREEILGRLAARGLLGRNDRLELPRLPLRVGLITSLGSDAYNDVLRTLRDAGFAFRITAHGARVQGRATEPSVLNALDWFRERASSFDVVLICRGGGSRTDLVGFDSEPLGVAVAEFPLPVLVGIGHEQDRSVLDGVARSFKTPTATAAFLVERVQDAAAGLDRAAERVVELATTRLATASERIAVDGRRVARSARHTARSAAERLVALRARLRTAGGAGIRHARDRVARASVRVAREARRRLRGADERVARAGTALPVAARRLVGVGRDALEHRARCLHGLDPRRVVERGFAILRGAGDGRAVRRVAEAPDGTRMTAELRDGRIALRSEGVVELLDDEREES